jgi:cysteine desulfurase
MTNSQPASSPVYLDNASTTRLAPEVLDSMHEVYTTVYGNASAIHRAGSAAARLVERSRAVLAERLGCEPDAIYFTASGTEANNWALKSVLLARVRAGQPAHLIVTSIEHSSILETAAYLASWGVEVTYLAPDAEGQVSAAQVQQALRPETALVSVMQANNEMGALQPLEAIGEVCAAAGVLLHTDACQSFPRERLHPHAMGVQLATLNAHKVHGPKGVGALYVQSGLELAAFVHGGGQEAGLRAGTLNSPAIVGFGRAVELVDEADTAVVRERREELIEGVLARVPGARLTGHRQQRLATVASFVVAGHDGRALQRALDREGITVATGSACHSGSLAPSHVLLAMGLDEQAALGSLRLSLSRYTTSVEVECAVQALVRVVGQGRP